MLVVYGDVVGHLVGDSDGLYAVGNVQIDGVVVSTFVIDVGLIDGNIAEFSVGVVVGILGFVIDVIVDVVVGNVAGIVGVLVGVVVDIFVNVMVGFS